MDINSIWGVKADSIIELKIPHTFGRKYVIDGKYLLKESEDTHGRHVEAKAVQLLKENGVMVPEQIGENHIEDGRIRSLYHLHGPMKELDEAILGKIAHGLAAIAKQDKAIYEMIKVRRESLKESLVEVSRMIRDRADPHTMEVFEKAILALDTGLIPFLQYFNTHVSHGDMHPDNLLMEEDKVIFADWETVAIREELYDLASLLGCIAIQEPTDILGDKAKTLLSEYVKEAKPSKLAYSLLPELVISSRLNWLCKWLILDDDKEIIMMETELIQMLLENREKLRKLWLKYAKTDFRYSRHKWFLQDAGMMDDVNLALERLKRPPENDEALATDLRLSMIHHGQNDDILNLLRARDDIAKLHEKSGSHHVLAELTVAMGNSCLDLSKFRLTEALDRTMKDLKGIIDSNPNPDLKIGYAFSLRNNSIALAEAGQRKRAFAMVAELARLSQGTDELEIKGEYARSLSNAITTLLSEGNQDELDNHFVKLADLYRKHDTPKIRAAYQIAKANIVRAGYRVPSSHSEI